MRIYDGLKYYILNDKKQTPAHIAAIDGDVDKIREIAKVAPETFYFRDSNGAVPIWLAMDSLSKLVLIPREKHRISGFRDILEYIAESAPGSFNMIGGHYPKTAIAYVRIPVSKENDLDIQVKMLEDVIKKYNLDPEIVGLKDYNKKIQENYENINILQDKVDKQAQELKICEEMNNKYRPHIDHNTRNKIKYEATGKELLQKLRKTRKHEGIEQSGGNKGRLKKGYKYSGKRLKNGFPQIIKCKAKKR